MYYQIAAPQRQLSKDAVKVWIIRDTIGNLIGFIVLAVLFILDYKYSWPGWIGWILLAITIVSVIGTVWSIKMEPILHYKNWRYDVNEEFLQLNSGIFNEKHELIPMTKIQSVATNQGPLLRKYGLYSISIKTMASSHDIPALSRETAIELREQIAHFAKIKEVE